MPDPLSPTPTLHPINITGAPLTTIGGAVIAVGQYLTLNGTVLPHDQESWISFILGIVLAILAALAKQPGQ